MTGTLNIHVGDVVALRPPDHGARVNDVPPAVEPDNVIPFARAHRHSAAPDLPKITIGDRLPPPARAGFVGRLALAVVSLAAHGALVFAVWEEPRPLDGIGLTAISVEVVIGDNKQAGAAITPSEDQAVTPVEEVKADDKPVEQERVAEVSEEPPKEQQPETGVMTAEVLPEAPNDPLPVAEPKPPEVKEAARREAREQQDTTSGLGPNIAASLASYTGQLVAHLQRHQQYPLPARNRGIQGIGNVSFSIDASGNVISVRVVRTTGSAILDEEMVATVRRASPVPAPPGGQARSFNAPVTFGLK